MVRNGWPATLRISQKAAWTLSLVLILSGAMPIFRRWQQVYRPHAPLSLLARPDAPALGTWRDPEQGGAFFLPTRLINMPLLYGGLHILPAILWCLLVPLQLNDRIRATQPKLHRISGYVVLACHGTLCLTGLVFPLRHHLFKQATSYSHANLFHLHKLVVQGWTVAAWPTFDAFLLPVFVATAYCLARTTKAAQNQLYAEHRTWAIFTALCGYLIAWTRIGIITLLVLARGAQAKLSDETKQWLGLKFASEQEVWRAEVASFALGCWLAAGVTLLWAWRVVSKGKAVWTQERGQVIVSKGTEKKVERRIWPQVVFDVMD